MYNNEEYNLKFSIPWIVKLYPIWKPLYYYDSGKDEYKLKYIEFLVFIHSVIDSEGNDVSNFIDYLEIVTDKPDDKSKTIFLKEVSFKDKENTENGDTIKNFRMNTVNNNDDIAIENLNGCIHDHKDFLKEGYFTYSNFEDKIYGTNSNETYDTYTKKNKKNYNGFSNGILFRIHLKKGSWKYYNYYFNKNKNLYAKDKNTVIINDYDIVYGMASNPFILPNSLFDDELPTSSLSYEGKNNPVSFYNMNENNVTNCFVCCSDVNHYISKDKIDTSEKFNECYKKKDNDIKRNYNYTLAVKELWSGGSNTSVKLTLCSPFELNADIANKNPIFQRYDDIEGIEEYESKDIEMSNLYKYRQNITRFSTMRKKDPDFPNDNIAEEIVCCHKGIDGNERRNNDYIYSETSPFDVSYNVSEKFILKKDAYHFSYNRTDNKPNIYIDYSNIMTINFGTVTWIKNSYNSLCAVKKNGSNYEVDLHVQGGGTYLSNKWFFGDVSDPDKPCLLFYGMYSIL